MSKKWKVVATYRYTHDKVVAFTGEFDDFEDIEAWMNTDPRTLEHVIITYNGDDERLTLTQVQLDETVEPPVKETADVVYPLS